MVLPPRFRDITFVGDRHGFLVRLATGGIVLHVGCAQHAALPARNLHISLAQVAAEVWGIDLDEQGIERLRRRGIGNLVVGDAQEARWLLSDKVGYFDVVLVPEILEHVRRPLNILASVSSLASDDGLIVVTGPNSFGLRRFIWAAFGREAESPDHRFTFHPSGLELLCRDAGLTVVERFAAVESSHLGGVRHRACNCLLQVAFALNPNLADSIGAICRKR